jgi:sugar/nucleoside kinase (ribokinase family)
MTAPASSNSWARSRNPVPSIVQPGVDAAGYHHSTTHFPAKSSSETVTPSWSGTENDGALPPASSTSCVLPPGRYVRHMPDLDVVTIGNALVDVLAHVDDAELARLGLEKSSYELLDADEADRRYALMPPSVEVSGGCAANTATGVVSMGGTAGFIGRVRDDQLGEVFRHDLRAAGVHFTTAAAVDGPATGRCLILVTPDAQRTMRTYLGAANQLTAADVDDSLVTGAQVVYVEGFLWALPEAIEAIEKAMDVAHQAGRQTAFTLSDPLFVENHRAEYLDLLDRGAIDVLFANEAEITGLFETDDFDAAADLVRKRCRIAALTHGADGSVVVAGDDTHTVGIAGSGPVVDTTGAGDLYAAGFLYGLTHGADPARCGELGAIAAAEVISHIGARPERPLSELI